MPTAPKISKAKGCSYEVSVFDRGAKVLSYWHLTEKEAAQVKKRHEKEGKSVLVLERPVSFKWNRDVNICPHSSSKETK